MNRLAILILVAFVSLLSACGTMVPAKTNTAYSEDLSKYRVRFAENTAATTRPAGTNTTTAPVVAGKPSGHLNLEMSSLLSLVAENNKGLTKSQGFKVQVYSGASRDEANKIVSDLANYTSDRAELSYTQPNYRVRIGNYFSRVEAYKTYTQIKKAYPNAIIVPDKIDIELRKYQR